MRYYDLTISDPVSGLVYQPTTTGLGFSKLSGGSTFTSYVNGKTLDGALNIEFDFPVYPFSNPQGNSMIRVWGVGLPMIAQATNLNGSNFVLKAGMQAGLPLANPAQNGVIAQGIIYYAYGNWQGVNQTLDLIVYPGAAAPMDIQFTWPQGTQIGPAIQTALLGAFGPGSSSQQQYTVSAPNIANSLATGVDQKGTYPSLATFAAFILDKSQEIGRQQYGENYPGVQIIPQGNAIYITDGQGPSATPVTMLNFQDLIGQPTWIGPATVNFKTVLRADIQVGQNIKFPMGINAPFALTSQAAASPLAPASSRTAFQGSFRVTEAHHFANFRQADAESWNTTFSAVPIPT
jgi:hypothetical protein